METANDRLSNPTKKNLGGEALIAHLISASSRQEMACCEEKPSHEGNTNSDVDLDVSPKKFEKLSLGSRTEKQEANFDESFAELAMMDVFDSSCDEYDARDFMDDSSRQIFDMPSSDSEEEALGSYEEERKKWSALYEQVVDSDMNQDKRKDVHEESQSVGPKPNAHEALAKIDIDMKLATHILLKEARKGSSAKNVVCSPLSLEFALHTVAAGSKGETLSQILQFIGSKGNQLHAMEDLSLKSLGIMRVASSYSYKEHRKKEWYEEKEEPKLSFANGVWVDQFYELKSSYKELMSSVYNAKAEAVDFGNQGDKFVRDINSWVADNTKGLIKEILVPGSLDASTMLIFVNALYFKGFWQDYCQFDEDMTVDRDFYILDGCEVSVPFMSRSSPMYYFRAFDGFKVLQLDIHRGKDKRREFYMQILLPDERDGLQNLIDKCVADPGFMHQDFGLKREEFKELWVPKFKFTYTLQDVSVMMKELGLTLPFMPGCQDLTEMVQMPHGASLGVSKILHKATIEMNESGVEAAAVTEVEYDLGCCLYSDFPPPPTLRFVADHPFIFVIKEMKTGAMFFLGAVFNPLEED